MPAYNIFETDSQEEGAIVKAALDARAFALITTSSLTGGVNSPYTLTISGRDLSSEAAQYYIGFVEGAANMRSLLSTPRKYSREELDAIRETWRKVAARENPRGGFLTAFAEAFVKADSDNLRRLAPLALELATVYNLEPGEVFST